ncbi:HEAT repeat domain-containing protein [Rhodopirellula sp.]|nr:HEAT repeat domain-containing protein [Rhodopirellula sp.]MDB4678997.1 HEAT repeat domain-containing protein [Rhodopirellula sp.]
MEGLRRTLLSTQVKFLFTVFIFLPVLGSSVHAEEAQWIWNHGTDLQTPIPEGQSCFFRKPINLKVRSVGRIEIAADDEYELYVNGNLIGEGKSSRELQQYDISEFLEIGRNVIAAKVVNTHGDTAALAARVSVKPEKQPKWFTFSTGPSWRVSTQESSIWQTVLFNDRLWGTASSFGELGDTVPWDRAVDVAVETQSEQQERFQIQKGFGVQRVLDDQAVGSIIAMTFNEFGHIIASQENGPLLLISDKNGDGIPEHVSEYCDQIKNCHGILALNGEVFATGDGPEGTALYRLRDEDRNGTLEQLDAMVKFKKSGGEHGPHGIRLGPDGMIYIAVGSHTEAIGEVGDGETLRISYEGDLLPRYEDPAGHGMGIKAPGGTIIRTDTSGNVVETVAGGIRNAYDLAFHPEGSLFVHDSDMEADLQTSWYRPTALFDVPEGGELGWRTGWSKWPEYYLDRLPNLLDTGRGSPTGATCYEHHTFPARYHQSLFLADWSEGRILNVRLKPRGAGYVAESEVFLQGQPLNVSDLEVGPDGAIYFCTGGRGTSGGIYRVIYKGDVPERIRQLGTGISAAIRQPQIEAAWARQAVASVRQELDDRWPQLVAGVALSDDNPAHYRTRAIDLMQLFGPVPNEKLLMELSEAPNESVRAKAAWMMGLHPGELSRDRLTELLSDSNPRVQRAACEAMMRSGQVPDNAEKVLPLLKSEDRNLAFVARRLLERIPADQWQEIVMESDDARIAILGMLALINSDSSEATCLQVLGKSSQLMSEFMSDADFLDTLRLCQLALHRGEIKPELATTLRDQIAEEFPAGDNRMNHELIRLAAYLKAGSVSDRALTYLYSDHDEMDRTLVAMYLQFLSHDWTAEQRFKLLKYYENVSSKTTSSSLALYVQNVTKDFTKSLSNDDVLAILEQGKSWRNAALAALYKLPRPIDETNAAILRELDQDLVENPNHGEIERRLRTGIIALLATASDETSATYLRNLWRTEPERRPLVAMALAQSPGGDNWDYLVRSLNVLEGQTASEVVEALLSVAIATDDPMALRQLILLGVRAEQNDQEFENVEALLEHWTGMQRPEDAATSMQPWQKWYAKTYPDRPIAELPNEEESRWDFDQLVEYLNSEEGNYGDPNQGRLVFTKAKCIQCHRVGDEGESVGPTLTGIVKRFSKREILESVLFPSHVISDQYASKKVLTLDGQSFTGMLTERNDQSLQVRDSSNQILIIEEANVDQILPSSSSIMPSRLLDDSSLREISDLMSYLGVVPKIEIATRP